MNKSGKIRYACITYHDYTEELFTKLYEEDCSYVILGREICPKTGRKHIQGYIEFNNPRSFKKLIETYPGIHLEKRKGSAQEASIYCQKDNDYVERGTLSNQGRRTDIDRVAEMVIDKQPLKNIAKTYPREYIKFHRGITALKNTLMPHRTERPKCYWFYGPTGTGKTYSAKSLGATYYIKQGDSKWWDGYEQQEVVIIDDFRSEDIPLSVLLRWLDENEISVEVKGSSLPLNSPYIAITCDVGPHQIWQGNDLDQIKRRLTGGIHYKRDVYK